MFTRKPGLLRRRNRAVTLIEAVLYISIALALIVGGLVFFQQASTAAKTSTMVRQLSATIAEARILMKGIPLTATPFNTTSYLISAGAVPPDMVASATSLSNPFGGSTSFGGFYIPGIGAMITIELSNIPKGVCARLLTASGGTEWLAEGTPGVTTAVASGYRSGGAYTPGGSVDTKYYAMNPTQAGWMCKYGAVAYATKTAEPSTTPLPGNVSVIMQFMVDG